MSEELSETTVLGVTVLTSLDEEKCESVFGCSPKDGVLKFAGMAKSAGLNGLILSPKELMFVRADHDFDCLELVTPGIRPDWSLVPDDDQSRIMTPVEAIRSGADRIVIGRPILQAKPNNEGKPQSPREAVEWTLKEIQQGLKERD